MVSHHRPLGSPGPRPRVALYSHDAQGLGHIRRNLAIAESLAPLGADVLLLTGAPATAAARRPPGVDLVAVPALAKDADGGYGARHLGLDLDATLRIRADVLRAAVASFRPDLLIVDKHPRGFRGEMEGALREARRQGARTVLGLRDVLDTPDVARHEWRRDRGAAAVAELYDETWVYGDPRVHDVAAVLDLDGPVRATGYLAHGRVPALGDGVPPSGAPATPYVLCVLGGGSDGEELAEAFTRAAMPAGHTGVLITGPHLPEPLRRAAKSRAARRSDLRVHTWREDLVRWYAGAAAVVAMGGYNTVCEVLATDRPLLVVPRTTPRAEQLVRAEAMARLGALAVCRPEDLGPEALTRELAALIAGPPPTRTEIDLDGLARVPALAAALIASTVAPAGTEPLSA
ncbi:glycosyl transferase family 28 [Serinibacter arcticus]|uniref:Glycosyl transferase family 28 n=1 Tax=Serinibacter arcticus TaxID=1655435 RepID=A0A2U1ZX09_9MICO|nr:glycosyltransferase [Serinibacter arcticus]PWD51526.1 glycosyl transferase family 28 [Serinibacter arcticus]